MLRTLGTTTDAPEPALPFQRGVTAAIADLTGRYPVQTLAVALLLGALLGGPLFGRR